MTFRISRSTGLVPASFRRVGRAPTQTAAVDEPVYVVAVVEATVEVEPEPQHTAREQTTNLARVEPPAPEKPEPGQLTRALSAYTRAQNSLGSFAVGRYLRVEA